jgi:osmotically-inducible protein OsmY
MLEFAHHMNIGCHTARRLRAMTAAQAKRILLVVALAFAAAASLTGCVGTAIGVGAMAGTAAMEERGLDGAISDTAIRTEINGLWSQKDERMWRKVGLQVYEGRVLLTGTVDSAEMREDAVRLAWQADGVKEVINEIEIAGSGGVEGLASDTWISTQLKAKLLFDSDVASINYSVETVNGVVYLLGIAQSKMELDRVTNHARNLDYVKKVVSYVEIKKPEPPDPS